ncbi:uncharacterized protein LOC118422000 [Branchiostoma floridae]|uniref:Uncharacterized protein LOC118422000 n=1 Tax=Branchiostoma floridae TaxID=7739 RepID=A0A9J7N0I6_BRAFL|nr:uncharacterized protein LOC118422000 [Branchiostoma floridae]
MPQRGFLDLRSWSKVGSHIALLRIGKSYNEYERDVRAQERKLTSCEMRVLRRAAGKTKRDRLRNEVVRELVGTKPVLQFIAKQRVQWFGHLMRLPTTQPALRAYTTRHSGVRARGRPRRRWTEGVAETVRAHGLTLLGATHLARDRCLHLPATPPQA